MSGPPSSALPPSASASGSTSRGGGGGRGTLVNAALAKKPPRKTSKKVGPGRPDAAAQIAFEALLREAFGTSKADPRPEFPDIPESSDDWPRHPPAEVAELPPDHPEASLDPALQSQPPPRGEPKLRLDWVNGRLDDNNFKSAIRKFADIIAADPDDFDLPDDAEKRSKEQVRYACKRTLENIKRNARKRIQDDAAAAEAKKKQKEARDRRRMRRQTRLNQRIKAAPKLKSVKVDAIGDLINFECVEGDETEDEGEATGEGKKKTKVVREVIPEWWSAENRRLQRDLDAAVPSSSSGYPLKTADWLTPVSSPLDASIPRIAVSSTFAQQHPDLVRDLQKNPPPYKPMPGAIAADGNAFGRPIPILTVRSAPSGSARRNTDDDSAGEEGSAGGGGNEGAAGSGGAGGGGGGLDDDEDLDGSDLLDE
ncbi:hypothetical protein V8E36_001592 [Tilletia maclaganii]